MAASLPANQLLSLTVQARSLLVSIPLYYGWIMEV